MQQALQTLLELLLVLFRLPKDTKQSVIDKAKQNIEDHKALIATAHGDSELNHPNTLTLIDDLTEVAATSDPDDEYAETPSDLLEEEQGEDDTDAEGKAEEATSNGEEQEEEKKPKKALIKKSKPEIKAKPKHQH